MEGDDFMSAIAGTFLDTAVLDLDALRRMTYDKLHALYRSASATDKNKMSGGRIESAVRSF